MYTAGPHPQSLIQWVRGGAQAFASLAGNADLPVRGLPTLRTTPVSGIIGEHPYSLFLLEKVLGTSALDLRSSHDFICSF